LNLDPINAAADMMFHPDGRRFRSTMATRPTWITLPTFPVTLRWTVGVSRRDVGHMQEHLLGAVHVEHLAAWALHKTITRLAGAAAGPGCAEAALETALETALASIATVVSAKWNIPE
jgi:hypothetical protein